MKKALLSLAVIAASGAYVAYEHLPAMVGEAAANSVADTALSAPVLPSAASADPTQAAVAATPATPAPADTVESATAAPATATLPGAQPAAPPVAVAGTATSNATSPDQNVASVAIDTVAPAVVPLPAPSRAPTDAAVTPATSSSVAAAATQPASGLRNGTFTGISANAYYGSVQVAAVIKGGQLTSVKVLDYPSDRRTSQYINSRALPALKQEAIQAQSANIDTVSGATLTSEAFIQSLDAALSAARNGGGNNA